MSSLRLPRWTALLLLPLLVGALLLMHGLDAGATTSGLHGAATAAPPAHDHAATTAPALHLHDGAPAEHHDEGCAGCTVGHVMAACVAIVATVVGLHVARRRVRAGVAMLIVSARGRIGAARPLPRPPDPAWVRLAVMRC